MEAGVQGVGPVQWVGYMWLKDRDSCAQYLFYVVSSSSLISHLTPPISHIYISQHSLPFLSFWDSAPQLG
jgi:hypothetical protein